MREARTRNSRIAKRRARKRRQRERRIQRRDKVVERYGLKCKPGGGRNRRDRRDADTGVVHITHRVIEGLPFVARLFMKLLMLGIVARAQFLYPVRLSHFLFMSNHPHLLISGTLNQVSSFMNYLDGELAKILKRLCPKKYQSTVFGNLRFKEERLYTAEDVLRKIVYIYANPSAAGLVNRIEDYPGINSWKMFYSGGHTIDAPWVPPRFVKGVPKKLKKVRDLALYKDLKLNAQSTHSITIAPYAWKKFFPESREWTDEYIFNEIQERLKVREAEHYESRGGQCLGAAKLKSACIWANHFPKKQGITPFLSCHDPELRKELIASYRAFCAACREAWMRFKSGEHDVEWPPGCIIPPKAWRPSTAVSAI